MLKDEYKLVLETKEKIVSMMDDMKDKNGGNAFHYLPQWMVASYAFNLRDIKRNLDKLLIDYQRKLENKE